MYVRDFELVLKGHRVRHFSRFSRSGLPNSRPRWLESGMASPSNMPDPAGRKPPSFGIGQFLLVVFLAIIFFLLGQSMLRHRFFQGQRYHRNGSIGQ
jgi:hypothetical protein